MKSVENTISVINYLKSEDGKEKLRLFKELVAEEGKRAINYSNFIIKMELVGGTTAEGVNFDSATVERGKVTEYILNIL